MFDSVLRRSSEPQTRVGYRALLSLGAHALVLGGVIWVSSAKTSEKSNAPEVTFYNPNGKGAPGPPKIQLGNPDAPVRTEPKPTTKKKEAFNPNAKAKTNATAATTAAPYDDDSYGSEKGSQNGSQNGTEDGREDAGSPTGTVTAAAAPPAATTSAPPKNAVIPFGPGMERPKKLSGPDPVYTRDAREAKVEGKMLVQCVITADGKLSGCSVLKSLPFMDQAVLSALAQQTWSPATVGGQPVSVLFTIPFKFSLNK